MEEMKPLALEFGLAYYEEVREIYLHPNLFSVTNGLLSSSGKLMRQKLVKYFKMSIYNSQDKIGVAIGFLDN